MNSALLEYLTRFLNQELGLNDIKTMMMPDNFIDIDN